MGLYLDVTSGDAVFRWDDDEAETTVPVKTGDTDEVMVRKLKRIIALMEGPALPPHPAPLGDTGGALIRAAKASAGYPPTLGWTKPLTEPPPVPEGADYELIPPGEGA